MVKHGRHLSLIYGKRFTNICKIYVLVSSQTHYVKLKIAEICGNPNLLSCNKMLEIDKVTMQRGCMWDHIHILWEDVVIRHAEVSIQVREHMSVPLIDRYRMRRMFTQVINYSFMVQQGDTWIKVPLGFLNLTENNFQLVSFQIWPLTPVDLLLKRLCMQHCLQQRER